MPAATNGPSGVPNVMGSGVEAEGIISPGRYCPSGLIVASLDLDAIDNRSEQDGAGVARLRGDSRSLRRDVRFVLD